MYFPQRRGQFSHDKAVRRRNRNRFGLSIGPRFVRTKKIRDTYYSHNRIPPCEHITLLRDFVRAIVSGKRKKRLARVGTL